MRTSLIRSTCVTRTLVAPTALPILYYNVGVCSNPMCIYFLDINYKAG